MNIKNNEIFINLGGVFPFFLIPVSEISRMSDLILGEISEINFKNSEFTPLYISTIQESSKLSEKQNAIDNFEYTLSAVISKNSLYYRNILEALNSEKHICIVPDANNNFRILGNIEDGTILTANTDTGTKVSDLNNISIKLKWQSNYRAAYTDLYKKYIMKCDTDLTIQPYISTIDNIIIVKNTSGTLRIDGANFDENMTISLGNNIVVNSYEPHGSYILINYTAGAIQMPFPILIKRGDYSHYGETPNISVLDALTGTGPAGDFVTNFSIWGTPNNPYGEGWNYLLHGNIVAANDYFKTLRNDQATPSNSTGPISGGGSDYSYIEVSNPNNGAGNFGEVSTSNFREITNINFRYHRYGDGLGDFVIYSKNRENIWNEVFRMTGEQQFSSNDAWLTANIDMQGISTKEIKFVYEAASNYRGDMAIDNIVITSI